MSGLPRSVVAALNSALEREGIADYDAAIVIVRVPSGTRHRLLYAHTGSPNVLGGMLAEATKRLDLGKETLWTGTLE